MTWTSTASLSTAPTSSAAGTQSTQPQVDCIGLNPEAPAGFFAEQRRGEQDSRAADTTSSTSSTSSTTTSSSTAGTTGSSSSTGAVTSTGSTSTLPGSDVKTGEGGCIHPACIGDASVSWQLHDHQPRSCGFGQDYGQDVYYGKTTMVVFLAGWCEFCVRQTVGLEKLRIAWAQEGKDINILIINAATANSVEVRRRIVERTSNPVFQDTKFSNVWDAMKGFKDTFFIYDGKGILRQFLVPGGAVNIDLSSEQGFAAVKERAEMVLAGQQ